MDKQSSYFTSAQLTRAYDLAGPPAPTKLQTRNLENSLALGGMRRPDISVQSNPLYRYTGSTLHSMALSFIDYYPETLEVVRAIRQGNEVTGFSQELASSFRTAWFHALGTHEPPRGEGPDHHFLEAWGVATRDCDAATVLPGWLRRGAPIGILEDIECVGVFPPVEPGEVRDPSTLHSELAGWTNYVSAEDEPGIVMELLAAQERKHHCRFFNSYKDLTDYLGTDEAVLTKLALISKYKQDGTAKHRLIWDLLRSDVNSAVDLQERIVLPRIQDAVDDALQLRHAREGLEWLVLDISDAFHNVPMRPSERKFACGRLGNLYIAFEVLCMGLKSAPDIWGRFAACLGRILASVFEPWLFRSEIYMDDPLMAASGDEHTRDVTFTIALLILQCSGFPLAWNKSTLGTKVVWIGAQLSNLDHSVEVSIPQDKLDTLLSLTCSLRASTVASRRQVRSYCGKLSFVAGMLAVLRPFLAMLWGALSSKSGTLPGNLIHTRQMRVPLDWIHALLHGHHGPLVRDFPLTVQCADEGTYLATDACPWGMGGVKFVKHEPVAWFATPLTHWDLRRFHA